jgi:hypothetical protein
MISAIQTVPSAYIASQIVRQAAVSQAANEARSLLVLPSTTVSLGMTTATPVTYNASGVLDTGNSGATATVNQSISTQASVVTTDTTQDSASIKLAADLEASTIAENLAVLDKALDDALANQLLVNNRAAAAARAAMAAADASQAGIAERIESSRQIESARQETATNSTRTLAELLAATLNESNTVNVVNASQKAVVPTDSTAALPSAAPLLQPTTKESGAVTNTIPATTSRNIAVSNTTTNDLNSTSDVANSLVENAAFDSAVQAVIADARNPAYANQVAQNYASVAAPSPLSPSVTATPITPEEAAVAFAISSVTDLTQAVTTTSNDNVVKTDNAATLPLVTPQPQPITITFATVASTTPATTTNVVAASNTATNSITSTAEVVNSPVVYPVVDSAVQAVTTVAQDPAYANLVAGNYVRMAASSAQSPSVTVSPMRLEEIKPVIAIRSVTALTRLDAQNEGNGNPSSGFRQRAAISNAQVRQARAAI